MALVDVARAQDQRLASNSFAELAATVIQIRQREPEAIRVLDECFRIWRAATRWFGIWF